MKQPALNRLAAARVLSSVPLSDAQLLKLANHLQKGGPLTLPLLFNAFAQSKSADVGNTLVESLSGVPVSSLSLDEVQRVLQSYPKAVTQNATALITRLKEKDQQQQQRLAAFEKLTTGGNAARGRQVFFSRKAACSSCHRVQNEGGKIGPDLSTIGSIRQSRDLLEAILFPNASFARGYRPYTVVTEKGKSHNGLISRETSDDIVLRKTDLSEIRIRRKDIELMRESTQSIMPGGLESVLSEQELRDRAVVPAKFKISVIHRVTCEPAA